MYTEMFDKMMKSEDFTATPEFHMLEEVVCAYKHVCYLRNHHTGNNYPFWAGEYGDRTRYAQYSLWSIIKHAPQEALDKLNFKK